ncbi:hypothetical protein EVAR_37282_1 [Eumeta japonica]|uniref:Uncharacterized protein n=1 Tax=Eumeta variegata TaxID=151549 RepID=A0A4C1WJ17_EUMVA|nr:hypothetical protein EVAR_37282_1 [Eumeta japonica]
MDTPNPRGVAGALLSARVETEYLIEGNWVDEKDCARSLSRNGSWRNFRITVGKEVSPQQSLKHLQPDYDKKQTS